MLSTLQKCHPEFDTYLAKKAIFASIQTDRTTIPD
jgi:hypothetical protein